VPDEETIRQLGQMMVRNKTDPGVLQQMADAIGWADAAARLRSSRRVGLRRGDFGEVLAAELLGAFEGYRVPVRKLRYQTDPEQTMHGTDIVGFEMADEGQIADLHFVEGKLRTVRDLAAGVEAHQQLADDRTSGYADTLSFLADRLAETDGALFAVFVSYLAERGRAERGSHGIFLVSDAAVWDEDGLVRINQLEDLLDPIHVRVVRVANLSALVERSYDVAGADVVDDGS